MKPGTPFLVLHQRKETQLCLSEPLYDCLRFSVGDRRVYASVDHDVRVRLVSCGIENREVRLGSPCHLFIGVMKYGDVVGTTLPVFVEHKTTCQVARV